MPDSGNLYGPGPVPRVAFAVPRPTVLVVDDDASVGRSVARVLRGAGAQLLVAESAADARRVLAAHEGDLHVVISDQRMPEEDGASFLAWMRDVHVDARRILFTGFSDLDRIQSAVNQAGIHHFLHKPWDNHYLTEVVRQAVEQWHLERENRRLFLVTNDQNEALRELTLQLEAKVAERTLMLQRATEAWKGTFDSISDPLTLVDASYRIRRANLAAAGKADDDIRRLIGRKCHHALFGRETPCEGCPLHTATEGQAGGVEITDARTGRIWALRTWALRDDMPAGEGEVVCHYRDVTRDRQLQRQVIMLEKMAAVGELAGCVAHELNNPLTGILTFSQLIGRGVPVEDVPALAADIEEAARRCSAIVKSLLDFARPGAAPTLLEPIDVGALIESCLNLARVQAKSGSALELSYEASGALRAVRGNPDALKSLFLNLINNAVQAMGQRGTVRVVATMLPDEAVMQVQVMDSGPGVDATLRDRIFEPFFTTKAKNQGGTGLGLAIVSNVARDLDGRVDVHNLPEGGACFTVELPAVTDGRD